MILNDSEFNNIKSIIILIYVFALIFFLFCFIHLVGTTILLVESIVLIENIDLNNETSGMFDEHDLKDDNLLLSGFLSLTIIAICLLLSSLGNKKAILINLCSVMFVLSIDIWVFSNMFKYIGYDILNETYEFFLKYCFISSIIILSIIIISFVKKGCKNREV